MLLSILLSLYTVVMKYQSISSLDKYYPSFSINYYDCLKENTINVQRMRKGAQVSLRPSLELCYNRSTALSFLVEQIELLSFISLHEGNHWVRRHAFGCYSTCLSSEGEEELASVGVLLDLDFVNSLFSFELFDCESVEELKIVCCHDCLVVWHFAAILPDPGGSIPLG